MTDHKKVRIAGRSIAEHIRHDIDAMTDVVLTEIVRQVEYYQELPTDVVLEDVRRVIGENIRLVADVMETGVQPNEQVLGRISASAQLRSEEGLPIERVMDAYLVGVNEAWRVAMRTSGPEDFDEMQVALSRLLGYLRRVIPAVVGVYVEDVRLTSASQESGRGAFLHRLLTRGEFDPDAARSAGIAVTPAYAIVALAMQTATAEPAGSVAEGVRQRRRARAVERSLRRHASTASLIEHDLSGALILVPQPRCEPAHDSIEAMRTHLENDLGTALLAAQVSVAVAELGQGLDQVRAMREAAVRAGRAAGTYALLDLALEIQLQQSSPVSDALADLLRPLQERPDLLNTLDAHLRCGLRRRETAALLSLHPNSVDYRMRKVGDLTGIDLTDAQQVATVTAALAALRARRAEGGADGLAEGVRWIEGRRLPVG